MCAEPNMQLDLRKLKADLAAALVLALDPAAQALNHLTLTVKSVKYTPLFAFEDIYDPCFLQIKWSVKISKDNSKVTEKFLQMQIIRREQSVKLSIKEVNIKNYKQC